MASYTDRIGSSGGGGLTRGGGIGGTYQISYGIGAPEAPPPAYVPAAVQVVTGVNPVELNYALYGHPIPLSVFGVGRIGGEIIAGPWVENGLATFCISFGVPADPFGTRTLREIAFDSEVVWENGGFNTEAFTFRFYPGTLTQAADPIELARYGADAIAYRPQILIWFENLPLSFTKFKKIPYVAAVIADSTGDDVNLGEAFERLAYSPWVQYTAAEFETIGITDGLVYGGLIFAESAEFLSTCQQFARFYSNWDILQTDKLRIVDRGANLGADIALDKTRLMDQMVFTRVEQNSLPRELELSTIANDADYTIVPSKAVRPRDPVVVSASVSTESVYLPMITDMHTRQSIVTFARYHEEVARKKVNGTAMMYGLGIEPGDLIALTNLGAGFENEVFKITETLHGANYTVEFTAEAILKCALPAGPDPYWIYVVLLMGYEPGIGMTDESLKHHGVATGGGFADTAQHKFGLQSMHPASWYPPTVDDDWAISSSNSDQFTVECWVHLNTITGSTVVMVGTSFVSVGWHFSLEPVAGTYELRYGFFPGGGGAGVSVISSGADLTTNIWYHVAVDKDSSGKIRLYKNGVMVGSATPADSSIVNTAFQFELDIGAIGLFGGSVVDGHLDELRITKGVARYASDGGFPAPTDPWPRGGPL